MPRPAPIRQVLGATLAVVLLAAASPAAAEPTPSAPAPATPSSSSTPTASSSTTSAAPSPTATPRPSDAPPTSSASTSSASTSSPAARSTASPNRKAGKRVWPERVRALFDMVERLGGTAERQRLRTLVDEDAGVFVITGCTAAPGATTTADATYFSLDADDVDFAWTVTGAAGVVVASGTGTVEDEEGEFTIEGLGRGDFTLDVTVGDQPEPSATLDFTVFDCITTTVSCKAVTFVNPAANPGALVLYGVPGTNLYTSDDNTELAELPAGGEVTVRTALTAVGYGALVVPDLDEDENSFAFSLVGDVDFLAIPTDCERPLSTLSVSCVDDHPRLNVTFAREGSDQPIDFTVTNRKGKVVASGFPGDGRTTASARLPGPGRYTYRSYFEQSKAYETLPIEIDSCGAAAPAGDHLADTGPPPLLPLVFGVALLAAGALLLTRRTRPARQATPRRRPPTRGR